MTLSAPAGPDALGAGAAYSEPIRLLLARLHADGVRYCHWKSNEHLGAGLQGGTDLDVLVDRTVASMPRLLEEAGFKAIAAVPERGYPGVEDYLAMDPATGTLLHLHLHYHLVLGARFLKGHRLAWEEIVLATRCWNEEHGIFVSHPAVELVLLLIRAALKIRWRDRWLGSSGSGLSDQALRELRWLRPRVGGADAQALAAGLVGARAAEAAFAFAEQPPSRHQLTRWCRTIVPDLDQYRTHPALQARLRRWSREARARGRKLLARYVRVVVPSKHTVPRGGLIIVFLGADGSGKSTLAREIQRWLSWKLDVLPIYFGSGDGPASILRWPLRAIKRLRRVGRPPDIGEGTKAVLPGARPIGRLRALHDLWWGLALAREKRARLAQARQARNRGLIVVCDRYPQSQITGFSDGPRLSHLESSPSSLARAAARRELAAYRSANVVPPDLVLKLQVNPAVAGARKLDMNPAELTRRVQAVRDLRFPGATVVEDVDADRPLSEVVLEVKRAIWRRL